MHPFWNFKYVFCAQEKGRIDATELTKARARSIELELQVGELKKDLHVQTKEKEKFKSHSAEADKKVSELTSKVESVSGLDLQIGTQFLSIKYIAKFHGYLFTLPRHVKLHLLPMFSYTKDRRSQPVH